MSCPVCQNKKSKLVYQNYQGYLETTYDIFHCEKCNTSYIDSNKIEEKIYDKIYNKLNENPEEVLGYDRYYIYAKNIKKSSNPLMYLVENESTYYPVYLALKNKLNLKVLEVGCGLGYLTYALKKENHEVLGIDISEEAINFSKENFGEFFMTGSIFDIPNNKKFDLIIGNELIEHLPNINSFIKKCIEILKPGGCIIITTPNKDYFSFSEEVWCTDAPPIHTLWLSEKSFKKIANNFNLKIEFINPVNKYAKFNLLTRHLFFRFLNHSSTKKNLLPIKIEYNSKLKNLLKQISNNKIIYQISNLIYNLFVKKHYSLFIKLTKN